MNSEKKVDFNQHLKKDFKNFEIQNDKKNLIMKAASNKIEKTTRLKKNMIIPLFGNLNSVFAKAAVIALILGSSMFALKFTDLNNEGRHYQSPQLVDTSFNGFDTSLVTKQNFLLR